MRNACKIALFLIVCSLSLLLAGCGSAATVTDPMALFERGRQTFGEADSVQMDVSCVVTVEYGDNVPAEIKQAFTGGRSKMMSLDLEMKSKRGEDGTWATMMTVGVNGAGSSSQQEASAFMHGDRIYTEASPGVWYYQDVQGLADLQSSSQGVTPASLETYMEFSNGVTVIGESGGSVEYRIELGDKYFDYLSGEMKKVQGQAAEVAESRLQQVRTLLSGVEFFLTVDGRTGFPSDGKMVLRVEVPEFIASIDPGLEDAESRSIIENTRGSYVIMDYDYTFSRYGENLNVDLPEKVMETASPMPGNSE